MDTVKVDLNSFKLKKRAKTVCFEGYLSIELTKQELFTLADEFSSIAENMPDKRGVNED